MNLLGTLATSAVEFCQLYPMSCAWRDDPSHGSEVDWWVVLDLMQPFQDQQSLLLAGQSKTRETLGAKVPPMSGVNCKPKRHEIWRDLTEYHAVMFVAGDKAPNEGLQRDEVAIGDSEALYSSWYSPAGGFRREAVANCQTCSMRKRKANVI